ncbi:hypothetical protein NXS98_12175 [Fontisphaera persica]|uniref:hypothetical protein n=1 Tax=Fontisphaera persica TaxID=2974023 RepID=UPI0024BFFA2F|nr:hypothetical protein [Fontisphaera persica]WCJ58477.1 hypothetical protein NXS98_12175 [Fontisphaera persica]
MGALIFSAWHGLAERQRQEAARREALAACERVLGKVDRRLGTALLLQEEVRAELLQATTAAAAQEMHPGRVRLALRRWKAQLEGAEADLRQFAEETSRLAAKKKLRHGIALLPETRQVELETLGGRLDGAWQELAALEQQADWLTLRWAQAVEQECSAARKNQAQQLQEVEKARAQAEADLRRMEAALARAHEQAARAQQTASLQALRNSRRQAEESPAPASPATVVQVNTGWGTAPVFPPVVAVDEAVWPLPPPFPGPVHGINFPYYGAPSYYDRGYRSRSRIIGFGVCHPRVVRIGPYLVVN